jgi:capsular polysaccharide biosynthesis protein
MEQQGYLRIFRERWVAIVLGVLVGIAVAVGVSVSIKPTYTATATSFLSVQSDVGSLIERSQFALARITSYPELATSSDVLTKTINDLGLNESVQQLAKSVTATNPSTTVLLQISASAQDPETAAAIANSVASNLSDTVSQLENSSSDDRYTVSLELRDRAQKPTSPSAPQRSIILGLGALGGLALGLIAAIIWARLDRTVRSARDARALSGLPVIGEILAPLLPFGRPRAADLERRDTALREAQLSIRQANGGELPRFLVLAPAGRHAGELQTRIGFARTFAATGRDTLLVEADFTGGIGAVAPEALEMEGLAEVLSGTRVVKRLVLKSDDESFDLLPAGRPEHAPTESAAERAIRPLLRELVDDFDLTLTQATSISRPATLELVAPYADGVVVLVRFGRTKADDLSHVLARLRLLEVRPLGIVITGVPRHRRSDLVADWRPGDFNEVPRGPVRSWADPRAIDSADHAVDTADEDAAPDAPAAPAIDEPIVIEPLFVEETTAEETPDDTSAFEKPADAAVEGDAPEAKRPDRAPARPAATRAPRRPASGGQRKPRQSAARNRTPVAPTPSEPDAETD